MDSYLLAVAAVALARGARRNVEHKVTSAIKVRLFCLLVWYGSEAGKVSGWQLSLIDRPLVASGNAVLYPPQRLSSHANRRMNSP
jgi:hypothetical protein